MGGIGGYYNFEIESLCRDIRSQYMSELESDDLELTQKQRKEIGELQLVHGKWKRLNAAGTQLIVCSNCDKDINCNSYGDYYAERFKYCPYCGAKMTGGDKKVKAKAIKAWNERIGSNND